MRANARADGEHGAIATRFGAARKIWRDWRSVLLIALTLASAAGAVVFSARWRSASETNASIDALRAGRDAPVALDASPELLLARVAFLAERDEIDRARSVVEALDERGADMLRAEGHYVLANALLRKAFDLIERGALDAAGPSVNLAKREYRRALQLAPHFWDAKFNFDVAARLMRDFPEFERQSGDELQADPRKLWTDAPGAPKGLP
ncbi:MAG: MxaK protein [Methylocystaceae bacterium]|nr:MAG: MxaK protein [Methylocystaceae bacterium]